MVYTNRRLRDTRCGRRLEEVHVRLRLLTAAAVALTLAIAAATAAARPAVSDRAQAESLTVWLMGDAQTNWPAAVTAANQAFRAAHPGVDVNVQYQSWGDYKTKFEATLSSGSGPDVIEFGNTDVPKYSAGGALAPLNPAEFPNSRTWLSGLTKAGSYNGKLYAVPYYAGARGVIYRTDQYKAAGIAKAPTTLAEFNRANARLMARFGGKKNPSYSAVYFPGRYWYAAMSFVYDYGGSIAKTKGGRWVGTLDSPKSLSGLTAWRSVARLYSRANKTGDEAHPQQALVFAKGAVGSFIGNGWEWPYALDPKVGNPKLAGKIGAYPMPSHVKGRYMPTFLGGSNLAVPVTSDQKALAADWIAAFTSTANMTRMATAGGVIPNTTSLARINASKPTLAPFAEAAKYSWFVPSTPNWANVESANVLQTMLSGILRNPGKTEELARAASQRITEILNER
ncbi:MAG TPA: extracellular solute-binding protein [Gaiellaceae bacterium]|nr:extracellular solute-binding protein [Gaiellaceae bacterium]